MNCGIVLYLSVKCIVSRPAKTTVSQIALGNTLCKPGSGAKIVTSPRRPSSVREIIGVLPSEY